MGYLIERSIEVLHGLILYGKYKCRFNFYHYHDGNCCFRFVASYSTAKNTIVEYLSKRGATDIVVAYKWFDFDRDTKTFSVEFTHPNGKKISTQCKLQHLGMFVNAEIFWSKPTELEEPQPEQIEIPRSEYFDLAEKIRQQAAIEFPTYEISTVLPIPNSTDIIVMMNYANSLEKEYERRRKCRSFYMVRQ